MAATASPKAAGSEGFQLDEEKDLTSLGLRKAILKGRHPQALKTLNQMHYGALTFGDRWNRWQRANKLWLACCCSSIGGRPWHTRNPQKKAVRVRRNQSSEVSPAVRRRSVALGSDPAMREMVHFVGSHEHDSRLQDGSCPRTTEGVEGVGRFAQRVA